MKKFAFIICLLTFVTVFAAEVDFSKRPAWTADAATWTTWLTTLQAVENPSDLVKEEIKAASACKALAGKQITSYAEIKAAFDQYQSKQAHVYADGRKLFVKDAYLDCIARGEFWYASRLLHYGNGKRTLNVADEDALLVYVQAIEKGSYDFFLCDAVLESVASAQEANIPRIRVVLKKLNRMYSAKLLTKEKDTYEPYIAKIRTILPTLE